MASHPTYHVNVIKLKQEIIWTGGLSHLSGLPHLPWVPHLHVNGPLGELMHPSLFHMGVPDNVRMGLFKRWMVPSTAYIDHHPCADK